MNIRLKATVGSACAGSYSDPVGGRGGVCRNHHAHTVAT